MSSRQGYTPQTVDKFCIWAVDNWFGWEKSGKEK
jgi:hypothetical protein